MATSERRSNVSGRRPTVCQAVRVCLLTRFTALIMACAAVTACGAAQPRRAAPSRGLEPAAFKSRLAGLRGYPVVVNKWASWCGPCQTEFPAFQRAAVKYGRQVAFVGLNGKGDSLTDAAAFLRSF